MGNVSLLLVKARVADAGKYHCNATNQFSTKKLVRNLLTTLVVMSRSNGNNDDADDSNKEDEERALLSKLHRSTFKIKSGEALELYCVNDLKGKKVSNTHTQPMIDDDDNNNFASQISWTFTPRNSNRTISLPKLDNELKYVDVSMVHDGIYNCSDGSDRYQVN